MVLASSLVFFFFSYLLAQPPHNNNHSRPSCHQNNDVVEASDVLHIPSPTSATLGRAEDRGSTSSVERMRVEELQRFVTSVSGCVLPDETHLKSTAIAIGIKYQNPFRLLKKHTQTRPHRFHRFRALRGSSPDACLCIRGREATRGFIAEEDLFIPAT